MSVNCGKTNGTLDHLTGLERATAFDPSGKEELSHIRLTFDNDTKAQPKEVQLSIRSAQFLRDKLNFFVGPTTDVKRTSEPGEQTGGK